MTVEVIHRDAHLIVVCKPSGLPTTSLDGTGCLVEQVQRLDPDAPRLHASSRLDTGVTGLVTFARTRHATKMLLEAREQGLYKRRYVGLMERAPEPAEGLWRWSIGTDPRDARTRVALDPDDPDSPATTSGDGRAARTRYQLRSPGEHVSVVDLWPLTGRTHQLRVHAARAGCPLLGDRRYGGRLRLTAKDGRVVRAGRVMLHCAEVTLPDPGGDGLLEFSAPLPPDMQRLLSVLPPGQSDT